VVVKENFQLLPSYEQKCNIGKIEKVGNLCLGAQGYPILHTFVCAV
jgi:hypothetical protein